MLGLRGNVKFMRRLLKFQKSFECLVCSVYAYESNFYRCNLKPAKCFKLNSHSMFVKTSNPRREM
jgi:hypothetical protein